MAVERRCSNILTRSSNPFTLCDPVTLTFDLMLIGGRGIVVDYLCAKFGDLVLSCGQTQRQTDRIAEADDRYTYATTLSAAVKRR